jgi:hypothetical protein
MNHPGEDGTTVLTFAIASNVPVRAFQKLLEIPCFDLGLPDYKFDMSPLQLATSLQRHELLTYMATLLQQ